MNFVLRKISIFGEYWDLPQKFIPWLSNIEVDSHRPRVLKPSSGQSFRRLYFQKLLSG